MKLPFSRFYLAVFLVGVLLVGKKFFNFSDQFRFIPDNGLEYAILRQMELERCFPLVGPALSISNVYTPPTYFYYLYLIGNQAFNPIFTGYVSALAKILTIVFLASTVWLVTNRRFFLISLAVLTSSWFLFETSRLVWHPNPVNFFLSVSIFLLTYAKIKRHWMALIWSFLMYWLATSIYPSPIILLPWYIFEIARWPRPPQRSQLTQLAIGMSLVFLTAVPFYTSQIIFETQHGWPTVQTVMQIATQPETASVSQTSTDIVEMYYFLMSQVLHLRSDWPNFAQTAGFVTMSTLLLALASIRQKSHHWWFYFPYLPFGILIALFWLLHQMFPGQLHQHWLSMFFFILVPALFEAVFRLRASLPLRVLSMALCAVLMVHNLSYYWREITSPNLKNHQISAKIERMGMLNQFFISRGIRPKSTLMLDRSEAQISHSDTFLLQYEAMDNWTLLHYQTLLPPIRFSCNEYAFFEADEIKVMAKNIFMLELREFSPAQPYLFEVFEKKLSFDLDEEIRVTWYVNTIENTPE